MAKRTPSLEQQKAIEHQGGVLLSAGAGAGKTFVLVEHIYYLLRKKLQENNEIDAGALKEYLSKIVLMTFTKKAAGELEIRMQKYLKEIDGLDILFNNKELVKECITSLNITTIHGFCYLLIQKGLIPKIDSNKEIISDLEFNEKINKIVQDWFLANLENGMEIDFIVNQLKLKEAFQKIYSSPELRQLWHSLSLEKNHEEKALVELKELLSFEALSSFELEGKESPKIKTLLDYFRNQNVETFVDLIEVDDFFKEFGTFPRSKELGLFKNLRDFLKKNRESIEAYLNFSSSFSLWSEQIKSLHTFLETEYLTSGGLNFSDLEYYVYEALCNEQIAEQIAQEFNYFIIDEFQDTSEVQFQIVNKILNGNFTKLFCVGDIKQAIYGFRGGEIKLIKNLSEEIPQYLNLKDNYRSGEKIVNFNNDFFSFLLNVGPEYEGVDSNIVPFEPQNYANKTITLENINQISINLSDQEKKSLSQSELEKIEANNILEILKKTKLNSCVLYRKLTPVKYLLPQLIENKLSFSLQMKVNLKKDPLWSIFKLLLESGDQAREQISLYFSYLNIDLENLDYSLEKFSKQKSTIGLWQSFLNFLYSNGIHNSNFQNNLSLIESLCRITNNDVANCRERIEDHEDGTYSIDFRYGQDSEKITIMTIHGSKGLEFEHVILGGVSTNGKGAAFDKSIGALPLSFKWSHKGKSYKSPSFLVEELHYKKSEFSESKRLFYVACTRAVKELSWIDISLNGKEKSYSGNSWINGIRKWQGDRTFITNDEVFDDRYFDNDNSIRENQRPEFHLSNLGIVSSKRNPQCSLSVVPELSVTRFSELAQCSRKFFLSNILKITDEDLEILGTDGLTQSSKTNKVQDDEFKSSKARGSDIHYQIESLIKGDKSIERTSQVIFVEKNLEKYLQDYTLHSEEPVRFSLFGHIVNGTPDLVLKPQLDSRAVEIWDFKTGGQEENQSYWLQLYCYALCFSFEYPNSEFVLKLLYVDAQKIVEKRCTVKEIKDYVLTFWKKTEDYSQVNTQHCHKCNFQNLCQEV